MCAHRTIGRRFESVTGTMVESAAISDMEDPVRLLTNLHHHGGGGERLIKGEKGSGRDRSLRFGLGR